MARIAKSADIGQRTARRRKSGRPATAPAKTAVKGRTSKAARERRPLRSAPQPRCLKLRNSARMS